MNTWQTMANAPRGDKVDNGIWVYCPSVHGLKELTRWTSWHADGGFCVDEIRTPQIWNSSEWNRGKPPKLTSADRALACAELLRFWMSDGKLTLTEAFERSGLSTAIPFVYEKEESDYEAIMAIDKAPGEVFENMRLDIIKQKGMPDLYEAKIAGEIIRYSDVKQAYAVIAKYQIMEFVKACGLDLSSKVVKFLIEQIIENREVLAYRSYMVAAANKQNDDK